MNRATIKARRALVAGLLGGILLGIGGTLLGEFLLTHHRESYNCRTEAEGWTCDLKWVSNK